MARAVPSGSPLLAIVIPAETMESVQPINHPNLVRLVLDNAGTDATCDAIASMPMLARGSSQRNASTLPMLWNWNAAVALIGKGARHFWLLCADTRY
jgi:hypothetical protein